MIAKIAATVSVAAFAVGWVAFQVDNSPFPQITTKGEIIAGLLSLVGLAAAVVAAIAWIWGA